MKLKAKLKGDVVKCSVQAVHEMTTTIAAKEKGTEANYITHILAKVGDRVIMEVSTSEFVSKDPTLKFQVKANDIKSGDTMEVTWTDTSGKTKTDSTKVK
ncbi:MAG: Thiosulfate oxidation carrier complex protein SoxZ [uncultured Sulfurovum sp.]|uniref:Thiosulfate oxidation carrier complex protein SoxZ n=1 Tax=uncultured Sulfurovum sp. TaxID=269237 RepID=A0A6S6T2W4_9BACT|nr:MAG: Thiosulfate oxidation carrier complex protein SoxZ [uncultured Sulfurovum sp.]